MSVKLNSTGGGSVTLDSPSTASNYTVTLPSAAGTLATTTGTGSVFTNPTINGFTGDTSAITVGTTQFVKDTSGNIGIGTGTPNTKLHVVTSGGNIIQLNSTNANGGYATFQTSGTSVGYLGTAAQLSSGSISDFCLRSEANLVFGVAGFEKMRLDSSGNLGLGVVPSPWESAWKSFDIGATGSVTFGYGEIDFGNNFYRLNTGAYRYKTAAAATNYIQSSGQHLWYNSNGVTGTANAPWTPTQAMTLNEVGNLLIGGTTNYSNVGRVVVTSTPTSQWGIDFTGSQLTIANGANSVFVYGSGLIILNSRTSGDIAVYAVGGSGIYKLGGSVNMVVGTTPSSGQASIGWNGTNYVLYNNYGATHTFGIGMLRTRDAN